MSAPHLEPLIFAQLARALGHEEIQWRRRRQEIEEAAAAVYETYRHRANLPGDIGYAQLSNREQQAWREVAELLRDWDWED